MTEGNARDGERSRTATGLRASKRGAGAGEEVLEAPDHASHVAGWRWWKVWSRVFSRVRAQHTCRPGLLERGRQHSCHLVCCRCCRHQEGSPAKFVPQMRELIKRECARRQRRSCGKMVARAQIRSLM